MTGIVKLTKEQIQALKTYRVYTGQGRLIIMPFIREGTYPEFRTRVYIKGASGFITATPEACEGIGLPGEYAGKAQEVARRLTYYYPSLPKPETMLAEAQLAGLPLPKAEGAEGVVVPVGIKAEVAEVTESEVIEAARVAEAAEAKAKAEAEAAAAEGKSQV